MINNVVIVGRLTKDPVVKMTSNGKSVVVFTVACNRDRENAEYIACRAYGKTAELLVGYCKKGSQIGLNGSVHAYTTEKDGQKQYHQEVLVNSIEFLSPREQKPQETEPQETEEYEQPLEIDNDDLPF